MSKTRSMRRSLARKPPTLRHQTDWLLHLPKPTRSYNLAPLVIALREQSAGNSKQRFFNEVLGEPFDDAQEPPC